MPLNSSNLVPLPSFAHFLVDWAKLGWAYLPGTMCLVQLEFTIKLFSLFLITNNPHAFLFSWKHCGQTLTLAHPFMRTGAWPTHFWQISHPHWRQWCFRRNMEKRVSHPAIKHLVALLSGIQSASKRGWWFFGGANDERGNDDEVGLDSPFNEMFSSI